MSVNAQYIKCDSSGLSDDEIIRGLAVVHADGRKGWNIAIVAETQCSNISNDVTCENTNKSVMATIRERLYLDGCGRMTMIFFNTVNAS